MKNRMITSVSLLKSLVQEADEAAKQGKYPGAASRSAIIELALDRMFHPEKYALNIPLEDVEVTTR
jgi:metal-responsive CopG/Arc/MetJ family transcriptional regulator